MRLSKVTAVLTFSATLFLAGCGGDEPKVVMPTNPTPLPDPNDRMTPKTEVIQEVPSQNAKQ